MKREKDTIQTIRLDPRKLAIILEEIRASEQKTDIDDSRESDRIWLSKRIVVKFQGKHSCAGEFEAYVRNISSTGISFIHGVYVYPETPCSITINTRTGEQQCMAAVVKRCRHVTGTLHEIGAQFESEIEIEEFAEQSDIVTQNTEANTDLSEAAGTILIIDDNDADRRLIKHHLSKSNFEFLNAVNGADALKQIEAYPTLVICDIHLPDTNGLELLKKMRKIGYTGPVIMETGDEMPQLREKAVQAGALDLIIKPCTAMDLRGLVIKALAEADSSPLRGNAPIHSTAEPDEIPLELVTDYIADLKTLAEDIESALTPTNTKVLRLKALNIKSSALGYGFAPLMHAARNLITSIDESAPESKIANDAKVLISTCRRAAVPDGSASKAA